MLFAVIGDPVSHSLSPGIHNAFFSMDGFSAYYRIFETNKESLPALFKNAYFFGYRGFNVTSPFKPVVSQFCHRLSDEATFAMGCNTLVLKKNRIMGYMTDGVGLLSYLNYLALKPQKISAIAILGCGASAQSIAYSILKAGCPRIIILNRTPAKAIALKSRLEGHFKDLQPKILTGPLKEQEEFLQDCPGIINCTRLGLFEEDPSPIKKRFVGNFDWVVDINYRCRNTKLAGYCSEKKIFYRNGLGMLFFQALEAHKLFRKFMASKEQVKYLFKSFLANNIVDK
ncbi:shikimate dehydrogenase family protein [Candidatus Riflebacteria bacterium]